MSNPNNDKRKETILMNQLPKQLSVKQTSIVYGIPEWTLRGYLARRLIPHRRVMRKIYIPTKKFEEWLAQGDVEPESQETKHQKKVKERIKKNRIRKIETGEGT